MINLSDSQKRNLKKSIKENKSVFIKLKPSQLLKEPKTLSFNPYMCFKKTKTGYSLKIDAKDIGEVNGGALSNIFTVNNSTANTNRNQQNKITSTTSTTKNSEDFSFDCCDKCHGKGLMMIKK